MARKDKKEPVVEEPEQELELNPEPEPEAASIGDEPPP